MARPSRINEKIKEQDPRTGEEREIPITDAIVRAISAGAFIEEAVESVGLAASTVYGWLARGEEHADTAVSKIPKRERVYVEFSERVTRAKAQGKVWHIANVRRHAEEDWRASKWWLSVMEPSRYSERHRVEHSGSAGAFAPAQVDLSKLTDAEVKALEELLEKAQEVEP